MSLSPRVGLFGVCVFALLLSGCGSLRLYSDTRDKQGEAVKKAWSEIDLKTVITTERENLSKLLAAEQNTQDQLAAGIRDQELAAMLLAEKPANDTLIARIDERLARLGSKAEDFFNFAESRKNHERRLEPLVRAFRKSGLQPPSCADIVSGKALRETEEWVNTHKERTGTSDLLNTLRNAKDFENPMITECRTFAEKEKQFATTNIDGELGAAVNRLAADKKELETKKKVQGDERATFEKALSEYDTLVKNASDTPSFQAEFAKKAGELKKATDALEKTPDTFTNQLLSRKRLEVIDEFLKVVTQAKPGEEPPADAGNAARATILLSNVITSTSAATAERRKLLVASLLLRKNYEALNLEAATRDIQAQDAVIRIDEEIVSVIFQQAAQLTAAHNLLTTAIGTGPAIKAKYGSRPLLEAFSKGSPEEKVRLYDGVARYLDAINRLEAKRYKLEYARIAAQHERALAYAEVNIKQWESLIGGSVHQLSTYGAGGIKPEHITNILNTLGILWIGYGVN